jgi:DeoR family transcriptional regulator, fructose operon transcriptional repressor
VLPADCSLTIVTNGGYIASTLARHPNLTVLAVGGRVRPRSLACVDDWALDTLSRLRVTVAFLGTNGLSPENGLTTPDPAEAAVTTSSTRWHLPPSSGSPGRRRPGGPNLLVRPPAYGYRSTAAS